MDHSTKSWHSIAAAEKSESLSTHLALMLNFWKKLMWSPANHFYVSAVTDPVGDTPKLIHINGMPLTGPAGLLIEPSADVHQGWPPVQINK